MLIPPFTLRYPQNLNPLHLDFTDTTKAIDPRITVSRASSATHLDSAGVLQTAGSGVARAHAFQDYNPSTLAPLGFLIEEQRTNSIRNNTGFGASAPSTLPTNWLQANGTGIAFTIAGTGTDNGIEYVDLTISGTTSGTGATLVYFDSFTQIVAANGETWTVSEYVKLQAGSLTNITSVSIGMLENTSGGATVTFGSTTISPTSAELRTYRPALTRTLSGGGTVARVVPYLQVAINTGMAVNVTLRIGLPQLELGAFATSVIKTTAAAATRLADSASITGTNFSQWYNQTEGTFVVNCSLPAQSAAAIAMTAGDGTANERLLVGTQSGRSGTEFRIVDGGVEQADILPTLAFSAGQLLKTASAYKVNDFATVVNGGTVGTDVSGTIPTPTALYLATNGAGTTYNLNIRSLSYFRSRLANATLQSVTT